MELHTIFARLSPEQQRAALSAVLGGLVPGTGNPFTAPMQAAEPCNPFTSSATLETVPVSSFDDLLAGGVPAGMTLLFNNAAGMGDDDTLGVLVPDGAKLLGKEVAASMGWKPCNLAGNKKGLRAYQMLQTAHGKDRVTNGRTK